MCATRPVVSPQRMIHPSQQRPARLRHLQALSLHKTQQQKLKARAQLLRAVATPPPTRRGELQTVAIVHLCRMQSANKPPAGSRCGPLVPICR